MSKLVEYVQKNCARPEDIGLGTFLSRNNFPIVADVKIDGRRVFLFKAKQGTLLVSKHSGIYSAAQCPALFPDINRALASFENIILDCELLLQDEQLVVFDVLEVGGIDLKSKPLKERRKVLNGQVAPHFGGRIRAIDSVVTKNMHELQDCFDKFVNQHGHEGLVLKNPQSSYGAPGSWAKWKRFATIDVVVTGRDPSREGASFFIGAYDKNGTFVDMGKVGSFKLGVDTDSIKEGSIVECQYMELTKDMHLRHPFVIKIRDDKCREECIVA